MLIENLRKLAKGQLDPDEKREGLCRYLFLNSDLHTLMDYPVAAYQSTNDLWDPDTEYGQARRRMGADYLEGLN
jgi:hypothetical protein